MKIKFLYSRKSITICLLICCVVGILLVAASAFFLSSQAPSSQAKQVLSALFTCTQQDEPALREAVTAESSTALTQYVNTRYPGLFTEQGCQAGLANRIFSKAVSAASQEKADFVVSAVELSRRKSDSDIWYFDYTVTAEAQGASGAVLQARGGILMVQDGGDWKAQSVTINEVAMT